MKSLAGGEAHQLPLVGSQPLQQIDRSLWDILEAERRRQQHTVELIASENYASRAVLDAQGSLLSNKQAQGYPGQRIYGGCDQADQAEELAIERARQLFDCRHANVQAHSGSQANLAVYLALLSPGDTILALDQRAGGHVSHGSVVNVSGRWFQTRAYGVDRSTQWVDMDEVRRQARSERPRLIIAGGSAYSRTPDFVGFRAIADEVGAYFMADMAHSAGLVAAGAIESPVSQAHVTTLSTHGTLRGPRGGMILCNDARLAGKFDVAVYPGLQGGPLVNMLAAKAVAFGEALRPSFAVYAQAVMDNARVLCRRLAEGGLTVVSGGTDCHFGVVDLRPWGLDGPLVEQALMQVGISLSKHAVPYDDGDGSYSGIRVGSAACTSRGLSEDDFKEIGDMILALLGGVRSGTRSARTETAIREGVAGLNRRFPLPY
ncbi:serine hydroxymethyltransferase [Alcaligenes sp. SDU_A2]|uniref:serine hydroxymethyltransferase n=1 Tax=Alcaligenes sp. SDU_A2 TaxID=3136634 RepID=UPI002B75CA07|nr:serine hydroxymethyltransferase [Alcaligenes sp.]HRL26418.1 serine hydroxymethyltransferase [Alcaligenes sp.]